MPIIMEKPDSKLCYVTSVFQDSTKCPELNDTVVMEPKCKKFNKRLHWSVSGKILKCEECLKGG